MKSGNNAIGEERIDGIHGHLMNIATANEQSLQFHNTYAPGATGKTKIVKLADVDIKGGISMLKFFGKTTSKRKYKCAFFTLLILPILYYATISIYAWIASRNAPYLGPESLPSVVEFSDHIALGTHAEIMETIMWRIYQEDEYRPYMMQDDFREVLDIFRQLQDELELLVEEIPPGEAAIAFNASNEYAQGLRGYATLKKSIVLKERGLSSLYTGPDLYWSVISNPRLSNTLKQINADKRIELIIANDSDVLFCLKKDYFKQSRKVFYTYCKNKNINNFIRGHGIKLDDHWKLDIMTSKNDYRGLPCMSYSYLIPPEAENDIFPQWYNQENYKAQVEEYQRILELFQKNRNYLDYIVNKQIPLTYLFLGDDWKKHLNDVPGSGFLENYNDYYFLGQNGQEAGTDMVDQIRDDEEFHQILNTIGQEGEIRSIYKKDGYIVVALAGILFEEERRVEFYFKENINASMDEDMENMKIDSDWFIYISPHSYVFF